MRVLAGDVGGTKTLLQLVEIGPHGRTAVLERRYESGLYPTFEKMLREFLALGVGRIDSACFAVAGPVIHQQAEVTNLHWQMEAGALQSDFDIETVTLINDFYAVALGVPTLGAADLLSLNAGVRDPSAPIAILGAGTGLGEAAVIPHEGSWRVVPSEGGHADFAPQNEEQIELLRTLQQRYGHVSYERVVSGMGITNIFTFLRDWKYGGETTKSDHTDDLESLPAKISAMAAGGDPLAQHTLEMFVDAYGAEAGNMALRLLARGGVFLAGGIAAKNPKCFTDGRFMEAFTNKGRFREMLHEVPVDLITNAKVGLMGAVEMAATPKKAPKDHLTAG
jgi:glucokinase